MNKKIIFFVFVYFFSMQTYVIGKASHSSDAIYEQIKDIYHPTLEDYYLIQNYLTNGAREGLEKLTYTAARQRNIKIIGPSVNELPQSEIIPVNTDIEDKQNCLVLYTSFNVRYPDGLKRLIKIVKESDFKGHILYHLGGWPDLEGGSLTLAHVPFAFKVCCFKEAQKLGYKRVLWLDSSIIPLVSLNSIFTMIEEKGYFTIRNSHNVGPYSNHTAVAYFGYTLEETHHILACQAGFLGVDLTTEHGEKIIDLWYLAAKDENAFYSTLSDQIALSLILHKSNLTSISDLTEHDFRRSHSRHDTLNEDDYRRCHPRPNTLFLVDRNFVQY
ncbi:MAG: hypothetical protein KR126chlam5_01212 [Candidatus Anoxychlamydiales bacterium]|nr:hypothetical protein [Candidatus Anoxychlamydiales bacterium]